MCALVCLCGRGQMHCVCGRVRVLRVGGRAYCIDSLPARCRLQNSRDKHGLLLKTISQIARLSSALRDSESASQQSIAELQRQTDAQILDMHTALAALDTATATPPHGRS